MKTSDFDYELPAERIAQTPLEPRHSSRLMVIHRNTTNLEHTNFWNIGNYLNPGDLLVINQTRVIPARIFAHKESGGKVEILLLRRVELNLWEALVGGKGLKEGSRLLVENGPQIQIYQVLEGARRLVHFDEPVEPFMEKIGHIPLPPYIHTPLENPERYQTVYAREPGSAAAPTAGLHFTTELLQHLEEKGIGLACLTLHVGLDTFAPVNENNPLEHKIHTEWCELAPGVAEIINRTRQNGGKIVAVGTTSVRALESAARLATPGLAVAPYSGPTDLFILPGYQFKAVNAMITNFHLPRSTLLMLVSSFAGRERILSVYKQAVEMEYRFYSFGDAMLIL